MKPYNEEEYKKKPLSKKMEEKLLRLYTAIKSGKEPNDPGQTIPLFRRQMLVYNVFEKKVQVTQHGIDYLKAKKLIP